jgi:hypothetical protein
VDIKNRNRGISGGINFMRNILNHGPRFAALLLFLPALIFVVSLFWHIGQTSAQVQSYEFIGPAMTVADCEAHFINASPPCEDSSMTVAVTFNGIAANYTGTVHATNIASYSMDAPGIASISGLANLNPATAITMTNGVINPALWGNIQASMGPGTLGNPIWTTVAEDSGDSAIYGIGGMGDIYAALNSTGGGFWYNPKSLGIACAKPGAASCGEPIDLGSGNVFDQVTDYETAGQNKLSLIRYYNSMATPDTYATSIGTNWRTNYAAICISSIHPPFTASWPSARMVRLSISPRIPALIRPTAMLI